MIPDRSSGRILNETLEIHTLELGWYNLGESDLKTASALDRWLFWLIHAHQYDFTTRASLFPQPEFQKATSTISRIAAMTEDKTMYDLREKAMRDQQWILKATRKEGIEEGLKQGLEISRRQVEIRIIQTLQDILGQPVSEETSFSDMSLEQLQAKSSELRDVIRKR